MFPLYHLKVAVLLSTFYLGATAFSGLKGNCNVGLTGVFVKHRAGVACADHDKQYWCEYASCSHKHNKWVQMNTCRKYGSLPTDPGVSSQQCVDYVWDGNSFACTNHAQKMYSCYDISPRTTPYITCTNCDLS